ncbi:hypothetical protein OS493_028305 [Desmophyllum pertusum]|uniref:LolA-like domain-containing protein n=1 Tax=Desmophyllum pertusum TaxID=174260 RepID=A0A9W9Y927_9CNID|nr:hypothetical protein OS493_028305 [Desmophyllum pertusum]
MVSSIICLICCLLYFPELVNSLDCSSNSQDPTYEPFPQNVTPPAFHTLMEISLSHRNSTYFVDERFDAEKERGAFTLLTNEYDWETYYDKSMNEIDHLYSRFYIDDCKSYTWTQARYDRYRCRFPPNESSLKLIGDACSATVVLDLVYRNKTKNARYLGRKTVRNIPVQGWRICKNETAMDYWFSVNGWLHTSGNTSVPVVVEARPQNAADLKGGMIHSYSFLDFFFNDPEFEVQKDVWCRGAVDPPPLPKLPRRFDVDLEHVNSDSTRIWAAREYYDLDKHLYRVDSDGHPNRTTETGPGVDIRDMTTRKSTYFNRKTGRCQERNLASVQPTVMAGRHHCRIDAPFGKVALFEDPEARPMYQGKGVARGIKCDVWRQTRVNWPGNVNKAKTIWRWYFTQKTLLENEEPQPVPVRLEIEGNITINATVDIEYEFNLNLYSFESRYPTSNAFSVSSVCPEEPTTQANSRLSSGAVAGVAIACIVLGLLIGALVVYLVYKRVALARMGPPPMKFP